MKDCRRCKSSICYCEVVPEERDPYYCCVCLRSTHYHDRLTVTDPLSQRTNFVHRNCIGSYFKPTPTDKK